MSDQLKDEVMSAWTVLSIEEEEGPKVVDSLLGKELGRAVPACCISWASSLLPVNISNSIVLFLA